MIHYEFNLDKPLIYHYTGKFQAPNELWTHMERTLSDYELFMVTEGNLYISNNKKDYTIKEGDYLLQSPGTLQKGYAPSNCSFYWLHFMPDDRNDANSGSVMSLESASRISLPDTGALKNPDKIIVLMKQLQDSIRSYHTLISRNYMTTVILCELYNQLNQFSYLKEQNSSKIQLFNDLVDYIHSHIHENITVGALSQIFGYNEKYMTSFFHKSMGVSLKQYILREKMEIAKGILTDTNRSISDIGYSLGYTDQHNFSKAFKKQVGFTPTNYRNTYANRMLFYE